LRVARNSATVSVRQGGNARRSRDTLHFPGDDVIKIITKSGAAIAAAAATLILSGAAAVAPASAASDGKVHCFGVNSCKGQGGCKTSMNDCKGMNSCKGHGWVEKTAAECEAAGGTTTEKK